MKHANEKLTKALMKEQEVNESSTKRLSEVCSQTMSYKIKYLGGNNEDDWSIVSIFSLLDKLMEYYKKIKNMSPIIETWNQKRKWLVRSCKNCTRVVISN